MRHFQLKRHDVCHHPAALLLLPVCPKKESLDEEPMQTDVGDISYVPGPDENPLYTAEPLTLSDLRLLSDLFHLPYEYGTTARTMLQELDWLKNHSAAAPAACTASATDTDKVVYLSLYIFFFPDNSVTLVWCLCSRRPSGAPGRSSLTACARRWCRCSTACPTPPTAASCTTCTTTSATSSPGSAWPEHT